MALHKTIQIRRATRSDIDDIVALNFEIQTLHQQIDPELFCEHNSDATRQYFLDLLESNDAFFSVANFEDGTCAGYVLAFERRVSTNPFIKEHSFIEIDQIAVAKHFQNQGFGKAMMQSALTWAASKQITRTTLNVWCQNETALKFYESFGFSSVRQLLVKDVLS